MGVALEVSEEVLVTAAVRELDGVPAGVLDWLLVAELVRLAVGVTGAVKLEEGVAEGVREEVGLQLRPKGRGASMEGQMLEPGEGLAEAEALGAAEPSTMLQESPKLPFLLTSVESTTTYSLRGKGEESTSHEVKQLSIPALQGKVLATPMVQLRMYMRSSLKPRAPVVPTLLPEASPASSL